MLKPTDRYGEKQGDKHGSTIVKRGGGRRSHDEQGSAWKVAFADFCLALMALFLVLWLMAAREQQHLKTIVHAATETDRLDEPARRPAIASEARGSLIERTALPRVAYETPAELAALSLTLTELSASAGLAANLATVVTPHGLRVLLHDTDQQGMFMRGSALPTGRCARLLQRMAPLFARMRNQMLIVGHTDASRFAHPDTGGYSNWALSTDRALAARAALLGGGMDTGTVLQVVGMADQGPLQADQPQAGSNRRIELVILTSVQARAVAAMFGAPALDAGSHAGNLEALRRQLPAAP